MPPKSANYPIFALGNNVEKLGEEEGILLSILGAGKHFNGIARILRLERF